MTHKLLATFCFLVSSSLLARTTAFSVLSHDTSTRCTAMTLGMAKSISKQADLMKKLKEAKQQARESSGETDDDGDESSSPTEKSKLSATEIKERNDRLRFQQLLETSGASVLNDYSSDGYLNKQQEEEEISAARK
jgi:hypothetical protein